MPARDDSPPTTTPVASSNNGRAAVLWLVLACLFWGMGFTWAKAAGEAVNERVGVGAGASVGPVWVLAVRFAVASVIWFAVSRAARTGWSVASVRRGVALGALLAVAMIVQHLGLDRTSEAVSAFLTSLTVVFVPILAWVFTGRRPVLLVWVGVAVATVGVWLMTGATSSDVGHVGVGEALGVGCAVAYAVYVLAVDRLAAHEHPARLVAGQFVTAAIVTGVWSAIVAVDRGPAMLAATVATPVVWGNVLLLATLVTCAAYVILTYQQPRIDPTRAAIVYLAEPIFGAAFAWLWAGHAMTGVQVLGAGIILAVNVVVELVASRMRVVVCD